jgi:hypothetical protein
MFLQKVSFFKNTSSKGRSDEVHIDTPLAAHAKKKSLFISVLDEDF